MCGAVRAMHVRHPFPVSAHVCRRLEKLRHLASVRLTCMDLGISRGNLCSHVECHGYIRFGHGTGTVKERFLLLSILCRAAFYCRYCFCEERNENVKERRQSTCA